MSDLPPTLTDKQAMFDAAYIGLAGQGFKQSVNEAGDCQYRGEFGFKCAIGHCIPDGLYDPEFEGSNVDGLLIIPDSVDGFAADLQWVHDNSCCPDRMRASLLKFAERQNLTIPSVEAIPAPSGDAA